MFPPQCPCTLLGPPCRYLPIPWVILGPQGSASLVGDGCLLATVRMEEQAFRFCLGCRGSTAKSTLRGQSPQDGIVPAETVTVVIIMDYGNFHSHSIQVYYAIYNWWCQWSSYTCRTECMKSQTEEEQASQTRMRCDPLMALGQQSFLP